MRRRSASGLADAEAFHAEREAHSSPVVI